MRMFQVMDKIERDLTRLGFEILRVSQKEIKVKNGSNDLVISYQSHSLPSPKAGIDGTVTPFLGMKDAMPVVFKIKSSIATSGSVKDVIDSDVAVRVLMLMTTFGNDLLLENSTGSFSKVFYPIVDHVGVGV